MKNNEEFGISELFFYKWRLWIFFILPIYAVLTTELTSSITTGSYNARFSFLYEIRNNSIDSLLSTSKSTMFAILAIFILYNWAKYIENGRYGYWLIQGISRKKFHFRLSTYLQVIIFAKSVILMFLYYWLNGYYLSNASLIYIILVMTITESIAVNFLILMKELIRIPELSLILSIVAYWIINNMVSQGYLISDIFNAEYSWDTQNYQIFILPIAFSLIFNCVGYVLHSQRDVNL